MVLFSPMRTGEVADGIYAINCFMVNMFLIKNSTGYIAIDAGLNSLMVSRALQKLNIDISSITHIFFTHTDYDHTGGVNLFKNSKIYISEEEEVMINKEVSRRFGIVYNKKFKRDYGLLKDGETVHIGTYKVKGILTPGHTVGSMSYLVNDKFLFTGDTISLRNGRAKNFPIFMNMNTDLQKQSIKRLSELEGVEKIFTAHFGMSDDFTGSFRE